MANIDLNCDADKKFMTRRLNWLMDDPLEPVENESHTPDPFGWSSQERQDWKDNGAFILAADGTMTFVLPGMYILATLQPFTANQCFLTLY